MPTCKKIEKKPYLYSSAEAGSLATVLVARSARDYSSQKCSLALFLFFQRGGRALLCTPYLQSWFASLLRQRNEKVTGRTCVETFKNCNFLMHYHHSEAQDKSLLKE